MPEDWSLIQEVLKYFENALEILQVSPTHIQLLIILFILFLILDLALFLGEKLSDKPIYKRFIYIISVLLFLIYVLIIYPSYNPKILLTVEPSTLSFSERGVTKEFYIENKNQKPIYDVWLHLELIGPSDNTIMFNTGMPFTRISVLNDPNMAVIFDINGKTHKALFFRKIETGKIDLKITLTEPGKIKFSNTIFSFEDPGIKTIETDKGPIVAITNIAKISTLLGAQPSTVELKDVFRFTQN